MKSLVLLAFAISISSTILGQSDTVSIEKPDILNVIEADHEQVDRDKSGKINFDHWNYSTKKHAVVGYLGSIFQGGTSNGKGATTWHYDLGAIYRGHFVDKKNYKLTGHAWVEHANLILGSDPKSFAKDLSMLSLPNASDAKEAGFSIEYLLIENYFFDGLWDVTIGKLEPLFYTTFTSYAGWDKLTFFSKAMSSNPVPDLDGAFGIYTELNFNEHISIGGQIMDDNPRNEYFDPANFFMNTTYAYQGFVRVSLPGKRGLYSSHILNFYTYEASSDKPTGSGWTYVGNQGISEQLILTLKLSKGNGRVLSYNGSYSAGLIALGTFGRPGDQFGFSVQVNELGGDYEYGIDTYYKLYLFEWLTASANLQGYVTKSDKLAVIPGVRVMMTY